jgi:4-hydroxyacetophenone monooxygenase
MQSPLDTNRLDAALQEADLRVLLMVLFHLTGETRWLEEPFRPRRDVKLIADEDAGFSPDIQHIIRAAALEALSSPELQPAVTAPDEDLLLAMMRACLAEDVAREYAPMMMEQMGFADLMRDVPALQAPCADTRLPVVIAGAGVSGIAIGRFLLEQGIPFRIIEKNSEVGGTWWQNTYPGCGVDTPNHAYSFSFGPRQRWRRFFSAREDIQQYLEMQAQDAGIYPHVAFETVIDAASWDEARQCWRITTRSASGTETIEAFALVSAVGQLNLPAIPELPGLEAFSGPLFHSSNWPADLNITGKRVAVVGTGASAMQIVPTIADQVSHLTVYQRSPQWARPIPRYHDNISEAGQWLIEQVPFYAAWMRFTMFWRYGDGLLPFLRKDPDWPHPERAVNRINDRHRAEMLAHIEDRLGEREDLVAKCVPDYPPYGKRILLDNGWFDALLKPQVELVTESVERLDETGITSGEAEHREFDVIVLATGFQVGKMAARLNITGRDGRQLSEEWADDDPRAYLGISVEGFPNLFCMMGPATGLGHGGSAMFQAEVQARYIVESLVEMINGGHGAMEVKAEVQNDFVARVDAEHASMIWTHPGVSTYYRNSKGRVFSLLPWRIVDYWDMTRRVQLEDYRLEPAA